MVTDRAHEVLVEPLRGPTRLNGYSVMRHTCQVCGAVTYDDAPELPCPGPAGSL